MVTGWECGGSAGASAASKGRRLTWLKGRAARQAGAQGAAGRGVERGAALSEACYPGLPVGYHCSGPSAAPASGLLSPGPGAELGRGAFCPPTENL